MTTILDDIYSSSNGDRWQLLTEEETGRMLVRHEPNLSSGGEATDIPVTAFLSRSGTSPQAVALRELLKRRGSGDFEDE